MRLKRILLFGGVCLFVLSIQAQSLSSSLHPKREFRAAWIQTVHGHFRDMPTRQLQDTLLVMLDSLRQVGMNAVIFQVRPEADTFYSSELEPWSRFLTGEQGKKPEPEWDPMRFMIEECHRRAMEFGSTMQTRKKCKGADRRYGLAHRPRRSLLLQSFLKDSF